MVAIMKICNDYMVWNVGMVYFLWRRISVLKNSVALGLPSFSSHGLTASYSPGVSKLTKPPPSFWHRSRQLAHTSEVGSILYYSIHVPGWLQKWLNLITAPGSVSNEPGSVTWLATKYLKTVSWRNHTEKLTTWWAQNISFWLKINIPSSYFISLMLNCLENTLKLQFDSYVTAVRFLT